MQFEFWSAGRIIFGPDSVNQLEEVGPRLGSKALLVLGGASAQESGLRQLLEDLLPVGAVAHCEREPTVEEVDRAVEIGRGAGCDVVVAAGGGAVLDCGKAAAGMMTNPGSLVDYLEGVGKGLQIEKRPLPMIAIPTTAGTGSEVTKNAVISGPGFKKSVRSPLMIPDLALVDPVLTHSTPPAVTASCGMDALTQVIEPYLSKNATPMTDGLALQGISAAGRSLGRAYRDPGDRQAREGMALASLLGGICLANAGLGAVHGFASPLGALFPIPHGVACAALLPQVVRINLEAARGTPVEERVRSRFATVARILVEGRGGAPSEPLETVVEAGIGFLEQLQRELAIPRLSDLGLSEEQIPQVVAGARGSSMRYNPVELTDEQLGAALRAAL
jgi:alcohol dehydrogenase class IV